MTPERTWSWFPKRHFNNNRFLGLSLESRAVFMSMYAIADETGRGPLGVPGMIRLGIVDAGLFGGVLSDLAAADLITYDVDLITYDVNPKGSWSIVSYQKDDPGLTKARTRKESLYPAAPVAAAAPAE